MYYSIEIQMNYLIDYQDDGKSSARQGLALLHFRPVAGQSLKQFVCRLDLVFVARQLIADEFEICGFQSIGMQGRLGK